MKKTTKKMRKWLSMLLAVILTVGIIPANVIAEDGQTLDMELPSDENSIAPTGTADASSGLVEDESRRDAFTKHYVDADGTYYAVVFSEQVHYEDNGRWKEVDNTLDYDSANKKYTAAGDRFGVGFADKASANELVSISDGEHTLSWTISFADAGVQRAATGTEKVTAADVSVQLTNRADNVNEIKTKENIGKMGKAVSGVRYNGVFKNSVDLRYSVLHGKIEEDVILNSPEGFSSYMLTVNTGGLTAVKQSDNSVAFVNTQGETIFTIGAPWMKDANAAVSSNIEVAVMQKGNTAYISYTPDSQWLNADERAYPVLIDPSFTTRYYTSNYVDTYVMGGDSSAAARASEETLKVGNYDGYPCYAYIKILNIPDFDDTVSITGASFDFWTYGTSTPALDLYEVTGSWTPSSMSYMNQPAADLIVGNKTGTVNEDNAKYSFNITSWVNDIFYTYGYVNSYFDGSNWKGFKVEYTNEVTNSYLEILSSENMDYADCRPTMTIQYRYFPFDGIEDGAVYSFKNASSSKYLTVYGGNTANSTNVIQSTSDNSRSQAFRLDETSNGGYLLRSMCSSDGAGSVLDFNYLSTIGSNGYEPENVYLYSYSSLRATRQEWLIEAVGSNMCKIVSRADPNLALTAYGSSNGTSSGTTATSAGNVFVSEYTGASNQHWYVYSGGMPVRPDQYNIKDQDTYTISVGSSWLSFCYPVTNYGDTVTLTSSNSYAVSINGTTGNVTPLLAGWATINAKINGTVVDQVTIYSKLDNGLYYFDSEGYPGFILGYENLNSVDESDPLKVYDVDGVIPEDDERRFIFKLEYLGNGKYSIRSMLSSDMGWTCSGSSLVSTTIGTSSASVPSTAQWYINAGNNGNYIYNSSTSYTVTASGSSGANVTLTSYSSSSTARHWNIHEVSGTYNGVYITSESDGVAVGGTMQMSARVYSSTTNSQTPITWSVTNGTGSATINSSTGVLTGTSVGTVTVKVKYKPNSYQEWIAEKEVYIIPIAEGQYFLNNCEFDRFMQINNNGSSSSNGAIFELWGYDGDDHQQWSFDYISNGYYKITSVESNLVATAPSSTNSSITQTNYTGGDNQLWKITSANDGMYKLSPKSNTSYYLSAGSGIISPNGRNVEMRTSQSDFKDEWILIPSKDISLIALPEDYDRTSFFNSVMSEMASIGYDDSYDNQNFVNRGTNQGELICRMANSKITVIRTHGSKTSITTSDGSLSRSEINNMDSNVLGTSELIIYGACLTGSGREGAANLVNATHSRGCDIVIGFEKSVWATEVNEWCDVFFQALSDGDSVLEACMAADEYIAEEWYNEDHPEYDITTDSWYIAGDASTTFS